MAPSVVAVAMNAPSARKRRAAGAIDQQQFVLFGFEAEARRTDQVGGDQVEILACQLGARWRLIINDED